MTSLPTFACKDENVTLKTDKQGIMDRVNEYFADIM